MTMVALVRFDDADVVIADSRVSWGQQYSQDSLIKIFRIDLNKVITYSGDVKLASEILSDVGRHKDKDESESYLENIVATLPRIAKFYFRKDPSKNIKLILGGYNSKGTREWWKLSSPKFETKLISKRMVSMGSGYRVKDYINTSDLLHLETQFPDLQERTTILINKFEKALSQLNESTVGGMFQVVSLYDGAVHPIFYGTINIDPFGSPSARHISIDQHGQLIQQNLINNHQMPLFYPSKVLNDKPFNKQFFDYISNDPPALHWNLSFFLTCIEVNKTSSGWIFERIIDAESTKSFPFDSQMVLAIGFWGPGGIHKVKINLIQGEHTELIFSENINVPPTFELAEVIVPVNLRIEKPEIVYLDCYVENYLLGRRCLAFTYEEDTIPSQSHESISYQPAPVNIINNIESQEDPWILSTQSPCLVYFFAGARYHNNESRIVFEDGISTLWSPSYPSKHDIHIATEFRLPKGKHSLSIRLVNALNRDSRQIVTASVYSSSSCRPVSTDGQTILMIPSPGIYFFNIYMDELLAASLIFRANILTD